MPNMASSTALTVQRWGNSLAVRIPAAMARSAHFSIGTPVELSIQADGIVVKTLADRPLTLAERLERFDPMQHGGEVVSTDSIGAERF